MDKYQLLHKLGQGSYAVVWKARNRSHELVAIKQFRQAPATWSEVKTLVEVKIPRALGSHRNVVHLKEVILEHGEFYLVYEYCESSVYETINHLHSLREGVNKTTIRWLMHEILHGLAHIHRSGFMHRDIKPENMLLASKNVKICDFGTAKAVKSKGDFTDYVGTRWYRAPECLLEATKYTEAVDMWAVGVIMAEFYLRRPIFPGTSDIDQLFRICSVMGSPTAESWREGHELARKKRYKFPRTTPIGIASLIPNASHNAIRLMESLLHFDPARRPSARTALKSHFFKEGDSTPLVPYVEKAKGKTRLEALKLQERILLAREGRLDVRQPAAIPVTEYADPLYEGSSSRNFSYGDMMRNSPDNAPPTEYADPLHEDSGTSKWSISNSRNFSYGNGYGGHDINMRSSNERNDYLSRSMKQLDHPTQSPNTFSNTRSHTIRNDLGGKGISTGQTNFTKFNSFGFNHSNGIEDSPVVSQQDTFWGRKSVGSSEPFAKTKRAKDAKRSSKSGQLQEPMGESSKPSQRRSRRPVSMLTSNDFDEIDARKRSSDTAVTSTSSVVAHTLKSPKPKKGGLHSTTRRKSPKNKNGKCDTGKKESKIEIQRGKSTPHGTNNFLTEGAGEFVRSSHALAKPHGNRAGVTFGSKLGSDDFWNSGTTNWSGETDIDEDKGEFMDEILSQWVDEDSKFSSDKSAANRASFGAAPVVTQKTSMFSLKTRTHSPRSPDSDLSPRPSNGGFWADPSPAIIGSRSTAGSSLASLASHSLSGHAQPLAPMSSGISVGSRMFTGHAASHLRRKDYLDDSWGEEADF